MTKTRDQLLQDTKKHLEAELFKLKMRITEKLYENGYDDFDYGYLRAIEAMEERVDKIISDLEVSNL